MSGTFVFPAMGTVVSVTVTGVLDVATRDALRAAFAMLENRFSLWRAESEASAFARREVQLRQTSPEFRAVYDAALAWSSATAGAFTPHRPDGVTDLSGLVKALGIDAAGGVLDAAGLTGWCLNAGGDVLTRGVRADGVPWVVGIVDPDDRGVLLSQATTGPGRRAVATSGLAERGDHVWRLGADATFTQVSVVAGDIVTADVLATAILAGGPGTLASMEQRHDIDVLACAADGRLWASPPFLAAA